MSSFSSCSYFIHLESVCYFFIPSPRSQNPFSPSQWGSIWCLSSFLFCQGPPWVMTTLCSPSHLIHPRRTTLSAPIPFLHHFLLPPSLVSLSLFPHGPAFKTLLSPSVSHKGIHNTSTLLSLRSCTTAAGESCHLTSSSWSTIGAARPLLHQP